MQPRWKKIMYIVDNISYTYDILWQPGVYFDNQLWIFELLYCKILLRQMSIICSSNGAWRDRCQYIAANYHFHHTSLMGSDRWFTYDHLNINATNQFYSVVLEDVGVWGRGLRQA